MNVECNEPAERGTELENFTPGNCVRMVSGYGLSPRRIGNFYIIARGTSATNMYAVDLETGQLRIDGLYVSARMAKVVVQ